MTDSFSKATGLDCASRSAPFSQLPAPKEEEEATSTASSMIQAMRLQFIHADHVKVPNGMLPSSWIPMGRTVHCAFQGVLQPGRVLTYQGHFEFDRYINSETIRFFGKSWESAALQGALASIDQDDDSDVGADVLLRFCLQDLRFKHRL